MPYPTPTSPTLNDLMYNSYDGAGNVRTSTNVPGSLAINVFSGVATTESMLPQFVGYSATANTSDFLGTAENTVVIIDQNLGNQFSANVSDTVVTAENSIVTGPFNPTTNKLVIVADTVVDAEAAVVVKG